MERQQHSPHSSPQTNQVRICKAHLTALCQQRQGRFAATGQRGKAPDYCPDCAQAVRRRQSRTWKIRKRQELGPAEYQLQYGAVYTISDEQCRIWREQKREQRAKLKQQVEW